jgi:hypothetical protein
MVQMVEVAVVDLGQVEVVEAVEAVEVDLGQVEAEMEALELTLL